MENQGRARIISPGEYPSSIIIQKGSEFRQAYDPQVIEEFDRQFSVIESETAARFGESYYSPYANRSLSMVKTRAFEGQSPFERNCSYKALVNGLRLRRGDNPYFNSQYLTFLNNSRGQNNSDYMIYYEDAHKVLDMDKYAFKGLTVGSFSDITDTTPQSEHLAAFLGKLKDSVGLGDWVLQPYAVFDENGEISHARTIAGFRTKGEKIEIFTINPYNTTHIESWSAADFFIANMRFLSGPLRSSIFDGHDSVQRNVTGVINRMHYISNSII